MSDARALLTSLVTDRQIAEIDEDIFDLTPGAVAHYDAMGWLYDAFCGTTFYNRVVWGTSPADSRAFATRIFEAATDGPHVELGCGALLFTAHLYEQNCNRPCILVDQSIAMLRMARTRLRERIGRVPSHVTLVRADGRELAFNRPFATTVLSMHVLHVVQERDAFLRSLVSLAMTNAHAIGFTSLVRTGSRRDVFLKMLHAAGELSPLMSTSELSAAALRNLPHAPTVDVVGNMAFVTGRSGS